jgi:hypothetical protein
MELSDPQLSSNQDLALATEAGIVLSSVGAPS